MEVGFLAKVPEGYKVNFWSEDFGGAEDRFEKWPANEGSADWELAARGIRRLP